MLPPSENDLIRLDWDSSVGIVEDDFDIGRQNSRAGTLMEQMLTFVLAKTSEPRGQQNELSPVI